MFPPIATIEFLYHKETVKKLELSIQDSYDYLVQNEEQHNDGRGYMHVFSWLIMVVFQRHHGRTREPLMGLQDQQKSVR